MNSLAVPIMSEIKSVDLVKKTDGCLGNWDVLLSRGCSRRSERPYYPRLVIYVDHDSRVIFSFFMSHPNDYYGILLNTLYHF